MTKTTSSELIQRDENAVTTNIRRGSFLIKWSNTMTWRAFLGTAMTNTCKKETERQDKYKQLGAIVNIPFCSSLINNGSAMNWSGVIWMWRLTHAVISHLTPAFLHKVTTTTVKGAACWKLMIQAHTPQGTYSCLVWTRSRSVPLLRLTCEGKKSNVSNDIKS